MCQGVNSRNAVMSFDSYFKKFEMKVFMEIPLKDLSSSDMAKFKACNFLVNVLSQMYEQWQEAPLGFKWIPTSTCLYDHGYQVSDFSFGELIWSEFATPNGELHIEPFGCIVKHNTSAHNYLIFRGSKSLPDFVKDFEIKLLTYRAPTLNPPSNINVGKGWWSVYSGLRISLIEKLRQVETDAPLTISGHSLGSTLATLATPEAIALGFQIKHYNSASPKVGDFNFKQYYESLRVLNSSAGRLLDSFRLVNTADFVPDFPFGNTGFEHVGIRIFFEAGYGDEEKNHDPCCCYGYALEYSGVPFNPDHEVSNA